jgi:hypothetical protein
MKSRERRWDELQTRWAGGERLSAEEELERLAYAEHDVLARKELEMFAELRARAADADEPVSPLLVGRALDAVKTAPRLRLVTSPVDGAQPKPPMLRPRAAWILVPCALAAAAVVLGLFVSRAPSQRSFAGGGADLPPTVAPPARANFARAELVLAAGDVLVAGRSSNVGQAPLAQGESVTTGEGRACLTLDPGVDVCLGPNSELELESLDATSIKLRVGGGTVLASLSRRAPGSAFTLLTAGAAATAHGTTYAVRYEGDETEVVVVEGVVEVARGQDRRELVDAHSRLVVSAKSDAFVRTPVGRSEEARLLALRAPHALWAGATVGVLELVPATRAAASSAPQVSIDDEAPLPLPVQAFVAAGVRRVTWRSATGADRTSWIEVAAGETRRLAAPDASAAPAAVNQPADKPSAAALLELARRELAGSRPRQALAVYEKLRAAYPTSPEARTVLITMGKLELDLGGPRRALDRFEAYLRGGGALAPEALAGKARALRALGRAREERRAIEQYLAAHPKGFEAPLFQKRLRELERP